MSSRPHAKSLKDVLLIHELTFFLLVILAGAAGVIGMRIWDKSSQESQRIHLMVQEIQQTRGDLYRQMKELFDLHFLKDPQAQEEYNVYTLSIDAHFRKLLALSADSQERSAIQELNASYQDLIQETQHIFTLVEGYNNAELEKALNTHLESSIFHHYEIISARAERLLLLKHSELSARLEDVKHIAFTLLIIPIGLALLLLVFSHIFLKRAIVWPIRNVLHATREISAGNLDHKAPEEGVAELAALSCAINSMAQELSRSQEALVRSEKQAALGLLVPMLAHNIRNPLASIRATAQVADSANLDQETRDSLTAIINTVDRLDRWTRALLAYLHPLKPHASAMTLRQVLQGALSPLQQKIQEKQISIQLPDWQNVNDNMFTDENLLEQALYNLLLNAVEASPPSSAITIECDIAEDSIRLRISDQGPGMPFIPDPHAASPAPTTKRFGTGLGIPFAFKAMEALSGHIHFNHQVKGGTMIDIVLPRDYEPQ
ncbi:sensor histidine kinase [Methylobacillus flagellatus]|uniref:histidine kinase n=1 Tax=Methylobacillus flagellatus (strain ATCC 51484 / DSM 6875 / VKM B-1610 / KT) TaxID=265072 RepID=Q1GYW3_METFK|nr:ATP-binding protein [Methylobacillus flagellatus]ABE50574.1 periplasmic sensor signal transduction histidine kinase [Methylobacillus flagellatus KT]